MFCTKCGNKLIPGANFCDKCGYRNQDLALMNTDAQDVKKHPF